MMRRTICSSALSLVVAAFFAYRGGMFGGGTKKTEIDVNVQAPATK